MPANHSSLAQTTRTISGRVWMMSEVPRGLVRLQTEDERRNATKADAPLVVRQHLEPVRSFVLLTSQGTHMIDKYHPVHQLRQLLESCKGPENDEVEAFFTLHKVRFLSSFDIQTNAVIPPTLGPNCF